MPSFTEDWFSGHIPHWERFFLSCLRWEPEARRSVVEIGSFEGRSTLWMLENLLRHPESRLFCIDTFEGGAEHAEAQTDGLFERFHANLVESGQARKVEILRGDSASGLLRLITRGGIAPELIYIDGSHEAPDVLTDLVLAFRLAPRGGVVLCDDYLWTREGPGEVDILNCPKLAIDAFTNIHRRKIEMLTGPHPSQIAFRKLPA